MVARRYNGGSRPDTKFIVLRRLPMDSIEVDEVHQRIETGDLGDWGSCHSWDAGHIAAGDWSPVQWFDGKLVEAVSILPQDKNLIPLGAAYQIGPSGQAIRGAFRKCNDDEPDAIPIFYSKSSKIQYLLQGEPEQMVASRPGKTAVAKRYSGEGSYFLIATRLDTQSGCLTGLYCDTRRVGSGWLPVHCNDKDIAKALTAWWNSTPCWLLLLNQRSGKLTWPAWSVDQLKRIPVPDFHNVSAEPLIAAFEQVKDEEMKPFALHTENPARTVLDKATAKTLGMDYEVIEN